MNKVELLSPAGNFETVLAAVNAGADAVYLGAQKFSARAFADNLSEEEIIESIKLCHLHDVKVYLTLNILLNKDEVKEVYDLIVPLYEAGLDGVIIQDLGVASIIKKHFPGLSLHASTQMSIMNSHGAKLLKKQGFERIVPARELTIEEVKKIKQDTGLELECFIHGAMCYSYSGLCLMSSIIGGRSGNRGKCAGTCRLPFRFGSDSLNINHDEYPLSMKDMCTLDILPFLIEAGIDSFKIEGRMKSPAYCAGVTSLYRKYIDLYNSDQSAYKVAAKDIEKLKSLYIRTDICNGYYDGSLGRKLLTMSQPGYNGNDTELIENINDTYVRNVSKLPIDFNAYFAEGQNIILSANYEDIYVTVTGPVCEKAQNAPLTEDRIKTQLSKLGDSPFFANNIELSVTGNIFVPMGIINSVRRETVDLLIGEIIRSKGYEYQRCINKPQNDDEVHLKSEMQPDQIISFDVSIKTREQLLSCLNFNIRRLYIDHALFLSLDKDEICRIDNMADLYISLPVIFRSVHEGYYGKLEDKITQYKSFITGLLVHTYDEMEWAANHFEDIGITTDSSIYLHNPESVGFIKEAFNINDVILPYELKANEYSGVISACNRNDIDSAVVVYGYIPLMTSSGCLKRTYNICDHNDDYNQKLQITDRYNHTFPIHSDCSICTNMIYNDRPLSLINYTDTFKRMNLRQFLINLSFEDKYKTECILDAFCNNGSKGKEYLSTVDTMSGHMKRGV